MIITAITTIAAFVFFFLYICKSQNCTSLERDNKWLKEQRERTPEPVAVDDVDNHPLNKKHTKTGENARKNKQSRT